MLQFGEVEVGTNFCIPSDIDHDVEWFRKLQFNKAISLLDGRVEHFSDNATVWLHEFCEE